MKVTITNHANGRRYGDLELSIDPIVGLVVTIHTDDGGVSVPVPANRMLEMFLDLCRGHDTATRLAITWLKVAGYRVQRKHLGIWSDSWVSA